MLVRVEERFDEQEAQVNKLVEAKMQESDEKIRESDILLRNVKVSFKI